MILIAEVRRCQAFWWRAVTIIALSAITASQVCAQTMAERKTGAVTGLTIPRYVSLKAEEVNSRLGPGSNYAIAWVFRRAGLPVEILAEFESFRQVRDSENSTGWVAAALLSGRRTAVVAPWVKEQVFFDLTASRSTGAKLVAKMEPGAIVDIVDCNGETCEVFAGDSKGFVAQKNLWGVYPGEKIK